MAAHYLIRVDSVLKVFPELSISEARVLFLYVSGLSAKDIAQELGISSKTVNNHMSNAKEKFDIASFSELRAVYTSRTILLVLIQLGISVEEILPDLSADQGFFVSCFSTGNSVRTIANDMNLPVELVGSYINSIKELLGLHTDSELRTWFSIQVRLFANSISEPLIF